MPSKYCTRFRGVSFSPDGDYLYYLGRDPETPEYSALFEIPSLGGQPRKRIFDIDTALAFSPDGRSAAFVRGVPQEQRDDLMIADLAAGRETVLASAERPDRFPLTAPSWSPDGSRVVAALQSVEEGGFRQALVAFHVETGERESVTEASTANYGEFAWLPDGRGLIGTRPPRPGLSFQVYFFPYPPGEPAQITNDVDHYSGVSVSSDGSSLAALRTSREERLWIVASDGKTAPRPLTSRSSQESIGNLYPLEGGMISFAAAKDRRRQLWTIDDVGSGKRQITSLEGWSFFQQPLPGGRGLVFSHFSEEESTAHVWRVDLDGGGLRRLTQGAGEFLAALSPDGRTALFARADRPGELWRVPVAGGEAERFLDEYGGQAHYSPDGRLLACRQQREIEGRQRNVWQFVPAEGGPPVASIVPPGDATDVEWLPDGSAVTYLHAVDAVQNVWRQAVDGGDPVQVTRFAEGRIDNHEHSPDGSRIALERASGSAQNLWTVDARGNDPVPLTDFRTGMIFDFDWSADGKSLVVQQGDLSRDVVMIRQARE